MTKQQVAGVGMVAGAFALALVTPASAQRGGGSYRPRTQNPPPQFQHLDPFQSTPEALLRRDFQYMRDTSPYGRAPIPPTGNIPPRVVSPGGSYYPGGYPYTPGYPYYGGGYGYGGYGHGGYIFGGGVIGGGTIYGGFGFGGNTNTYQREVIIIQGQEMRDAAARAAQDRQSATAPRETPAPTRETPRETPGGGEFYLNGRPQQGESISDALDDLRKAWLNGDFERLKARFRTDGKVRVFPKGQFKYAVDAPEFTAMLKDAMKAIDTLSFELDRPKSEEPGRAFVTGKHTFMDAEKQKQETYVSYTLERVEGKWKVVEAGSSSAPITKHQE